MQKRSLLFLVPVLASAGQSSAGIRVSIEIPRIDAGQYHRPYVASWIEKPDNSHVADLSVWYDVEMKNSKGESWLKDLRQWWRKSGRAAKLPLDGISGPTKPVGKHDVEVPSEKLSLPALADGEYTLVVEAAREVGGRETVRVPFKWDGKTAVTASASGKNELGQIQLQIETSTPN